MESQTTEPQNYEDVRKSGYLRKQKSMHRRYFVLRTASVRGPARLEYYESEKKFRGKAPVPKKALALETCFNINKRADSKNKHMIVLYTRSESFAIAAENEADQDEWYQAMVDLQCKIKTPSDGRAVGDYGMPNPGPAFKEVWQVKVWPKGLGQAKNLVGVYRLCLTDKTVNFVKLNSDAAAVVLQLMNVRRCGHSENFFFVEVGRSAVTGPGEFWMQVDDSVVAQNMHETLLEAMKALSEEFRQRSKSQSNSGPGGGATASNPISVPSRRHHPNPPPSQVGFSRRPRTEPAGGGASSANASPTPKHSFPRSRTASDGAKGEEGRAGAGAAASLTGRDSPTTATTNGSCSNTPILRSKSARSASTPAKTPLGLMRSVSTPGPSPAPSLSSSSGRGSEYGGVGVNVGGPGAGAYSRMTSNQALVSGTPSDYGSSDEYGSSPGDSTLPSSPSLPGCSGGSQDPGDEATNYILMGQRGGGVGNGGCGVSDAVVGGGGSSTSSSVPAHANSQALNKRVLRRSSSRECEADRRVLSKRASLPPMALERLAPRPRRGEEVADEDSADYAIMSRSTSRESFTSSSTSSSIHRDSGVGTNGGGGGGAYMDVAGEFKGEAGGGGRGGSRVDNGYMSMLPGVKAPALSIPVPDSDAKPAADDYMAMTPNSVSPPLQIRPPPGADGYMMMSPNSSCSPDQQGGLSGGAWAESSSADSRAGSDYMNMSPISARSANSSPPPLEPPGQADPHTLQQAAPKMVYSYYSLPRSYKHTPSSRRFEDGPGGRGGRPNGEASRGAGDGSGAGGRPEPHGGAPPAVGHHLSLSSSSYSSSSASSESLGEVDERVAQATGPLARRATAKDWVPPQQRRVGGAAGAKQGGHARTRPVSLFVDVSKANTLPRVRENPLPPEPKSPGEYVSIEYKGGRSHQGGLAGGRSRGLRHGASLPQGSTSHRPPHRPTSCTGNFLSGSPSAPITPPAASEYVNMDLGPSPSLSPLTPLQFPVFSTPPTPPGALAPKASDKHRATRHVDAGKGAEAGARKTRAQLSGSGSPTACGDYTEMAFSLNSPSPKVPPPSGPDPPTPGLSALGLDFSLAAKAGPNPDHGAKVIRPDPQGRRRHCSETFLVTASLLTSSATSSVSVASLFPEQAQAVARRLGFEGMLWGSGAVTDSQSVHPGQQSLPSPQDSSTEQGLNYIDLDLANKESPHSGLDGGSSGLQMAPSRLFSSGLGTGSGLGAGSGLGRAGGGSGGSVTAGGGASLNTYASIDFYKSEELRTHQNGTKDGTEC